MRIERVRGAAGNADGWVEPIAPDTPGVITSTRELADGRSLFITLGHGFQALVPAGCDHMADAVKVSVEPLSLRLLWLLSVLDSGARVSRRRSILIQRVAFRRSIGLWGSDVVGYGCVRRNRCYTAEILWKPRGRYAGGWRPMMLGPQPERQH